RNDLEANGRLVESRRALLEIAERIPLRLADRLAGRLDLKLGVLGHLRVRFFFRFTRRGAADCAAAAVPGFGDGSGALACVAGPSLGGVRELRFGGSVGFGTIRRVITPWPTVQRLVVIQYMSRPTGKRVITGTKKTGNTISRIRWLRCAVTEAKYPDATWLTT